LDVIADTQRKGKIRRFLSAFIFRGLKVRVKVLLKRFIVIAEQTEILGLQELTGDDHEGGASGFQSASLLDEYVIYGREREKEEIIEFLLSHGEGDNRVPIISIVGLNGIGKTTPAQLVSRMMRDEFHYIAWVDVSSYSNF
jgi:hypothetical protein